MDIATQRFLIFAQSRHVQCRNLSFSGVLVDQFPDAFQEAVRPFNARFLPLEGHIRRGRKHHEQTHGIRAVALNHHLRVDAVVFRLGHLAHAGVHQLVARRVFGLHDAAFFVALNDGVNRGNPVTFAVFAHIVERVSQHHALAQQLFRRLIGVHHARVAHQLMEEAEVEQVHDGVFDTADVDIYRQPVVGRFRIQHSFLILRAGVARIVPGGFHKGVKGVGFAQRRLAVDGGLGPFRIGFDRAGDAVHDHVFRQDHRQLIFRGRQHGAIFQGHHRDRRAPVALTGYAPVAQTVVNFTLAHAHGSQFVGNGVEARFIIKTAELAGVKQDAFLGQRLLGEIRLGAVGSEDNRLNVQTVLAGELVVALVVTRNGHYRAGAVFHQHKVCRPDRNFFTGQRMNGFKAGIDAFFLHRRHVGFGHFGIAALVDKGGQRRIVRRSLLRQRVTRRDGQVGTTHKGVRTGGVDSQFVSVVVDVKGDFYPFRTADPVALHGLHGVRPVVQLIQIVQQFIGVGGDFNKPLRDLFTLDLGIAAPAAAVDNLFVGQHGLVIRAPVHCGGFFVHQAFFVQLGEELLLPAVVFRGAGRQLAAPVIAEAQHFELVFHVGDVVVGPRRWRGVVFHRRPFCRQTERIPADRLQDVFAQHALVAGNHVADGVVTHVTHV